MSILSSLGHGLRLARAAYVFAREGAFLGVDPTLLPPVLRLPLGFANLIAKHDGDGLAGLSRAIDRLGPSYVKLGQFLSTRPDIVGGKVAIELERLQDRVAPMSRETAVAIIETSFGTKIDLLFEQLRRAGRGGFDCPSPPCGGNYRPRNAAGCGEGASRRY